MSLDNEIVVTKRKKEHYKKETFDVLARRPLSTGIIFAYKTQ